MDYDKAIGQPSKLGSYMTCFDHPGYIILTGTARSGTTYQPGIPVSGLGHQT